MSLEIVESAAAIADVMTVADYLAEIAGLNKSDQFLAAVKATYRQLAFMPGMGSPRDYGLGYADLRMWPVSKFPRHLIFYQTTETELRIIRLLHGAQDLEHIFNPPE
jgi:toxin ParE1/3/4